MSPPEQPSLFQRFHIRLTLLYAACVLGVLALSALISYPISAQREVEALQQRLLSTATALAIDLDGGALADLKSEADRGSPAHRSLERRLAAVAAVDPELRNLYVLMRTPDEGLFTFAADYDPDRPDETAQIGEIYDARGLPQMVAGLSGPSVEEEITSDAWGPSLSAWVPISDDGESIGILGIDISGERVEAAKRRTLLLSLGTSALTLLLLSIAAALVGRNVRDPLQRVISATQQISGGDLSVRLQLARQDEFGVIGNHLDQMAAGLEEREFIRDTLGRYVSEEVARKLLSDRAREGLKGEERAVTILFTDLRGYSTISEHLAPAEVVDLLNRYLGEMAEVIHDLNGVVLEFLGDGILAVFGAPEDLPGHPEAAVRCALAMSERLAQLNREWEAAGLARRWKDRGLDALSQRAGIHTGPVVAGNLGSKKRLKYSVIGDTVNVAARLEQLNKQLGDGGIGQTLFSDAVLERLPPDLQERAVRRGEFQVKGREQPVSVWGIRPS